MWIPKNKKTGIQYPAVTDAEKSELLKDPAYRDKYVFLKASESVKAPKVVQDVSVKKAPETVFQSTTATPQPPEAKKATPSFGEQ